MEKDDERSWLRVLGSGCLVNAAVTSLMILFGTALFRFTVDTVVFPFMIGATFSFALNYFIQMRARDALTPARKLVLIVAGVLLGSVASVLIIAGFMLLSSGLV